MVNVKELVEFVSPYYIHKDIMHNLDHIERMLNSAKKLAARYPQAYDKELITYACYFHGFIYKEEQAIRSFLCQQRMDSEKINQIIRASWESQADEMPQTLAGKILHDAHLTEGGKTYLVVKSLCTGTARGQTLEQSIDYLEKHILGKRSCCLPEADVLYKEMEEYAKQFIYELKAGLA
jgi:uncharacterized protein